MPMSQTHILIVGTGRVGQLTARELIQAGYRVTLLEQSWDGQSASWAGGGILSSLEPWRELQPIEVLAGLGQRLYPRLAAELLEETAMDIEYIDSGMLVFEPSSIETITGWAERAGRSWYKLSAAELAELEPLLDGQGLDGQGLEGQGPAIRLPDIAQVRSPRLLQALRLSLQRAGARFTTATVTSLSLDNGRCASVVAGRTTYSADMIILAAGPWSSQILGAHEPSLPVNPVRGQMLAYELPAGKLQHIVLQQRQYLIPRRDGLILAGSTVEDTGFDTAVTADAEQSLHNMARGLMPELGEKQPLHHWSGLRPATPDGLPYIGRHPAIGNLFVNYGHFRNGILLAPASAKLLADIMLERDPVLPPAAYSPARALPD